MSKNYEIQKGVEMPKSGRSFGKLLDLSQMEIGDSFTFPSGDEKRVQAMIDAYGKKNGAAFLICVTNKSSCFRTA